jgi:transcriptional regulator with XRE-family HTH domain
MELSTKIRMIRKARGLSQEELGDSLTKMSQGISRQSVSDWETGKSEPKLDNIRDIATVLYVSYDALLDEKINLLDPKVFADVLNNTKDSSKNNKQPILYEFRKRTINVFALLGLVACLAVFTVAVIMLIKVANDASKQATNILGGINDLKSQTTQLALWLFISACFGPGLWVWLIHWIRKGLNEPYGQVTSNNLVIKDSSARGGYKLIPIEEIEKVEQPIKKQHTVLVYLSNHKEPLQLKHARDPNGLVDIIGTSLSTKATDGSTIK